MPNVGLTPGSGVNVAVNNVARDGVTEVLQLLNIVDDRAVLLVPTTLRATAAAAAAGIIGTAATAGAAGIGRLHYVTITAQGASGFTLTDGVGGTILFTAPPNAAPGEYPLTSRPFNTSLYANTGAGTPPFVVGIS